MIFTCILMFAQLGCSTNEYLYKNKPKNKQNQRMVNEYKHVNQGLKNLKYREDTQISHEKAESKSNEDINYQFTRRNNAIRRHKKMQTDAPQQREIKIPLTPKVKHQLKRIKKSNESKKISKVKEIVSCGRTEVKTKPYHDNLTCSNYFIFLYDFYFGYSDVSLYQNDELYVYLVNNGADSKPLKVRDFLNLIQEGMSLYDRYILTRTLKPRIISSAPVLKEYTKFSKIDNKTMQDLLFEYKFINFKCNEKEKLDKDYSKSIHDFLKKRVDRLVYKKIYKKICKGIFTKDPKKEKDKSKALENPLLFTKYIEVLNDVQNTPWLWNSIAYADAITFLLETHSKEYKFNSVFEEFKSKAILLEVVIDKIRDVLLSSEVYFKQEHYSDKDMTVKKVCDLIETNMLFGGLGYDILV